MGSCNGNGNVWVKIGEVNANQSSPPKFERMKPDETYICVPEQKGCTSFVLPSNYVYSKVCGRVSGFGIGLPNGFTFHNIRKNYVDGISITYNGYKLHIWTFVSKRGPVCNCNKDKPGFVGDNFSCMRVSSSVDSFVCECTGCSPEFSTTLQHPTSEDIEVRVCTNEERSNEQVAISHLVLYTQ